MENFPHPVCLGGNIRVQNIKIPKPVYLNYDPELGSIECQFVYLQHMGSACLQENLKDFNACLVSDYWLRTRCHCQGATKIDN